jgi:hypothetical protein
MGSKDLGGGVALGSISGGGPLRLELYSQASLEITEDLTGDSANLVCYGTNLGLFGLQVFGDLEVKVTSGTDLGLFGL